ncbi:MAG: SAM-dependent methyltransferase [Legionella sp.]|nr:MAG: SAM-dependent methyltransferase [Legionella sp.]
MIVNKPYTLIDGIKCYDPEIAQNCKNYPSAGFDVVDKQEQNIFWCRSRSRLLKRVIAKYLKPNGSFLEIGCGTGFFIRELAKNSSYKITGSDVHLSGLKYAQEKSPETEFVQLDATSNYISEKFDVIGAFDVIEHIKDDEAVLLNAYHSLVKGGTLILTVPQYQFLWSKLDELVKHQRRYSKTELFAKLHQQGFDVVFQSSFVFVLFPLMLVSRLLDKKHVPDQEFSSDEFKKRVKFPKLLNWVMDKLMYIDEFFIRLGVSLPYGGSLLVVARKRCEQ